MKKKFKNSLSNLLHYFGFQEQSSIHKYKNIAVELLQDEVDLIKHVLDHEFTMTSIPRLVNTLKSCRYVVENGIMGDFVECGVWMA